MAIDSRAVFEGRVRELGLETHLGRFKEAGWNTYAELAFSTGFTPGNPDEELFAREVLAPGLGAPEHADRPKLRRLFVEAYTLAAADLKRRVEAGADDAPRRVPALEREERRARVAARLVGMVLRDELDCSSRLIDRCIEMHEENLLRYVGPADCTKAALELQGRRKDPAWVPDASGTLKVRYSASDPSADIASQFSLNFALKRRGLAMEMADILSFECHERLSSKLVAAMMRTPLVGYAPVSLEQALRADLLCWRLMAERTRDGIKRNSAGQRPAELALDAVLDDGEFVQALLCLPAARGSADRGAAATHDDPDRAGGKGRKRRRATTAPPTVDKAPPHQRSKGAKGAKGAPRMPVPLVGKLATLPDGRRLCYNYNLAVGCTLAADGSECPRGWHLCMEPPGPCGKAHPCHKHR